MWWHGAHGAYRKAISTNDGEIQCILEGGEGPMLGLSNTRSTLQAHQLREQLQESLCQLIWISGDWNLSDSLTKKPKAACEGLSQFLRSCVWRLRFDPHYSTSENWENPPAQRIEHTGTPSH